MTDPAASTAQCSVDGGPWLSCEPWVSAVTSAPNSIPNPYEHVIWVPQIWLLYSWFIVGFMIMVVQAVALRPSVPSLEGSIGAGLFGIILTFVLLGLLQSTGIDIGFVG